MRVSWRYPLVLFLVCVPLLVVVPSAGAAPISVSCNGGGCVPDWYKTNITVAFAWDPAGVTQTQSCDTNTISSDTPGWSRTCIVTLLERFICVASRDGEERRYAARCHRWITEPWARSQRLVQQPGRDQLHRHRRNVGCRELQWTELRRP